ncbi:MAG: PPIC-type domain [Planctomycetota bacterium]
MNQRNLLFSLSLFAVTADLALAQGQEPVVTPAPVVQGPPTAADSPLAKLSQLEQEKARLEQELRFLKDRTKQGAMARMLQDKIASRKLELRSIDAGTTPSAASNVPASVLAPGQEPKKARVAGQDEVGNMTADVAMTINGRNVTFKDLEELVAYQTAFSASGNDELRKARAVVELLRIETAHAKFAENAEKALEAAQQALKMLEGGKPFGDVAKLFSKMPGAEGGGDLGWVTRNSYHGLAIERIGFNTKVGANSGIFRSPLGYTILQVVKFEKGEHTPQAAEEGSEDQKAANQDPRDRDKLQAKIILIPYGTDVAEVRNTQNDVAMGNVDIVVRNDEVMAMLPAMFRASK